MSKQNAEAHSNNLLRSTIQADVRARVSDEASLEPGRVLDFRTPARAKDCEPHPSSHPREMARRQKQARIVAVAVEKLDDNQLDSLLVAVERIAGDERVSVPT